MKANSAITQRMRTGLAPGPGNYDVLILDASMKQSLASARSLGRAGLRVAAGESVSQFNKDVPLPTFQSRFCQCSVVLPDVIGDTSAFIAAVLDFVRKHSPRVILPTGDITIAVLRQCRPELAELGCVLAIAPESALDIANDKSRTLAVASELGILHPNSVEIAGLGDLTTAVAEFGFPFVLKPTVSWVDGEAERFVPVDVVNDAEAAEVTSLFLKGGTGVLAQQWASGRREGVTLFIAGDEVAAACGHVAHRTTPPLGGASAVRESVEVPADTLDAAVRLAKAIGLQGVCEVEFRRDAENRPLLMEINARLAGTIENAVQSGVDLPLMIWRWATWLEVYPVTPCRYGVRTRWLHGDLRWLRQNWQRSGRPDGMSHAQSLYAFLAEFARSYHYDYFDPRDMMPFLAELRYTLHVLKKVLAAASAFQRSIRSKPVSDTEVVVIGAGPFGLSISAHLTALGTAHVIVGRPMDTWRTHMPDGMLMKSEPYASTIASPDGKYSVAAYCGSHRLDYVDRVGPLTRERFLDYADWYAKELVSGIRDETVSEVVPVDGGFRVTFASNETITARQVVVATGVLPYQHIPAELAGLPAELVTHTAQHHDLDQFKGRRVAVVGAGQSALETAALLHEAGVDVQIIARTPALGWSEANPAHLSPLGHLKRPVTQLCEGWRCAFWYRPRAFRLLPESVRITKARTVLGPNGSWWLKDRVDGVVDVLAGHRIKEATAHGSGVRLALEGSGPSQADFDHVIAGTGFRVDIARLPFLPQSFRSGIKCLNGHPVVNRSGETSVPGLYFAGAPTVLFIGPSARFVAGTHTLAAPLARAVARRAAVVRKTARPLSQEPAQVS